MVSNMAYAGVYTGSRLWCLIDQCLYTRPMLAHAFDLIECYRGVARNEREAGTGHPRQGTVILGKLPSHFETLARYPRSTRPGPNGNVRLYAGYLGALFGYLPTAAQVPEGLVTK